MPNVVSTASKLTNDTWRQQRLTAKAKSINHINFNDTSPNYYVINNISEGKLYFGVNLLPSETKYDMLINPSCTRVYARTIPGKDAYIYNPSDKDCDYMITSFIDAFDPSVLITAGMTELGMSSVEAIKYDGIIKGFTTGLPSGTNNIGKVIPESTQLNNMASDISSIKTAVSSPTPSGSNKIGSVDLTGDKVDYIINNLTAIKTSIAGSGAGDTPTTEIVGDNVDLIKNVLSSIDTYVSKLNSIDTKLDTLKAVIEATSGGAASLQNISNDYMYVKAESFINASAKTVITNALRLKINYIINNDSDQAVTVMFYGDAEKKDLKGSFIISPKTGVNDVRIKDVYCFTVSASGNIKNISYLIEYDA